MATNVKISDVRHGIRELDLAGEALCIHVSLSSFGWVYGGAETVIDGLIDEGCTVLVPAWAGNSYTVRPPVDDRPQRNGCDYSTIESWPHNPDRTFTVDATEVDEDMGIVPRTVVGRAAHARGYHPRSSFAALGPCAAELTDVQQPLDIYAPLEALAARDGWAVLMGVGLNRMTLLHQAEKRAGRTLFRRWANGSDGKPMSVESGSCSSGFERFAEPLRSLEQPVTVGQSLWRAYPAADTLRIAADMIARDPHITHCGRECERCDDAVAGGPIPG